MKKPTLRDRIAASTPRAEVTIRRSIGHRNPYWILEIAKCPLCSKPHSHGGGLVSEPPLLGHRQSHCLRQTSGYELVEMETEP